MPGKRVTKSEVTLRTQEVYSRLVKGQSRGRIHQDLSAQWGLSLRQIDDYIAKARKQIELDCDMSRPAFLAECLAGIRDIRENAERRGQHQVALNAVRLQAELTGLTKNT